MADGDSAAVDAAASVKAACLVVLMLIAAGCSMGASPRAVRPSPTDRFCGVGDLFYALPPDFRARVLGAPELIGGASEPVPGDRLTIFATVNTNVFGDALSRRVTKTVLENIRIIDVCLGANGKADVELTVAMTRCDLLYFDWLANNTTLSFQLARDAGGYEPPYPCPEQPVGPSQVNARYAFTSA